uniref:Uncharacterized protein n=1 Tax=Chromera velia CCMP2878 TaxID=1169474 RepID=A0A0K6S7V3_9ALVE|eukprot:Cvel_23279.t2-p1 / transcript=Cvel_23279.t2 / gene=Cvel_23279 / organism=Chromera_velia_CCMP2878 / gene_product=Sushi, von Willebrand factor type A, EGF and, putative / transcript_product=Sushi, von Willebrand factor type A, EGF and, putative / location=Cvel_scaffold2381:15887-16985(+) / protein_length=137 / sequence_SO=supercontig / SO=protein_coding / is_pseudo=false
MSAPLTSGPPRETVRAVTTGLLVTSKSSSKFPARHTSKDAQCMQGNGFGSGRTASKMTVSGSNDGSSWTQIGSYDGVADWSSADDSNTFNGDITKGPFSWFQFKAERLVQTSASTLIVQEIWLDALTGAAGVNCYGE